MNRVVLFAGAGFSADAFTAGEQPMPMVGELAERLSLFLYDEPYDGKTNLRTLYEAALTHRRGKAALRGFMRDQLHVARYPDWYQLVTKWFWYRIYTTNADDLLEQVYDKVPFPKCQKIVAPAHFEERDAFLRMIQLVKLHGCINDDSKDLTFGLSEYGNRASMVDIWYLHFIQDYSTRNTVFIGTQLDEPLFWQYLQIRQQRDRRARERRPKCYLVAPSIPRPMVDVLDRFNIVPVRSAASEFFQWLGQTCEAPTREYVLRTIDPSLEPALLAAEQGMPQVDVALLEYFHSVFREPHLPRNPRARPSFLLGNPPTWEDIAANMDAQRAVNDELRQILMNAMETGEPDVTVLYSAAGGGKSTIVKRVAIELVNEGHPVFFSEGEVTPDPERINQFVQTLRRRVLLVFDHAGTDLRMIGELHERNQNLQHKPVLLIVARANELVRSEYYLSRVASLKRVRVPQLSDPDITSLLETLDNHRMLGYLRGLSHAERVDVFRTRARKQILIAMREATTGRGFDEIIKDEFATIEPKDAQLLYLIAAIPSVENYGLSLAQMITAMPLPPNEVMNLASESLAEILVEKEGELGHFVIRHPLIAQFVILQVAPRDMLAQAFLAFLKTVSVVLPPPGRMRRLSKAFRVYRGSINHRRLATLFPGRIALVREIYEGIKDHYADDGHYWLQYGSYELVFAETLDIAENYINQAAAMIPNSEQITTATAHLLLKKSVQVQTAAAAESLMQEGVRILRAQMADTRIIQVHPYHIFGSQLMSYIRIWVPENDRSEKYRGVHDELRRSIPRHLQGHPDLRELLTAIKRAELETAIRRR